MELNEIRSAVTVFGLLLFAALSAWVWWPRRRAAFDAAARLPFEEAEGPTRPAERRAAPKPAGVPSGDRPTYPSDEGQT